MEQAVSLIGRQQMMQGVQTGLGQPAAMDSLDAFTQIFMNMMESAQMPQDMLSQLVQQSQISEQEQDQNDAAMEFMGMMLQGGLPADWLQAMLSQMAQGTQSAEAQTQETAALSQASLAGGSVTQVLELLAQQMQGETAQAQMQPQTKTQTVQPNQQGALPVLAEQGKGEALQTALETQAAELKATVSEQPVQTDIKDLFLQQTKFSLNRQAFQMRNAAQPSEEKAQDADLLQMQAAGQKNVLQSQTKTEQVQPKAVQQEAFDPPAKQITDQMQLNLAKGKSEFTIRLNPENLGEITVKLLQKEGKMVLSITAASEQTVKLLNGNLASLQEAVRPMQVEVRDAVVNTQSADGEQMQQSMNMNMENGNFFNQSQQMQQQMQREQQAHQAAAQSWAQWLGEDETASPEQAIEASKIISSHLVDLYF